MTRDTSNFRILLINMYIKSNKYYCFFQHHIRHLHKKLWTEQYLDVLGA